MRKGISLRNAPRYARIVSKGLSLLCILLLTGCANFAEGSGNRTPTGKIPLILTGVSGSQVLMLPSTQKLSIQGPFVATIHIGKNPAGEVTVRGDNALVDKVGYRYQGDNVVLVMNPIYAYPKSYSLWLDIYVSRLTYLELTQGSNASVGVLNNYYFQAVTRGNSQLTLFGMSRRMDLTAMDYSQINAKQVKSRTGFIKASQFAQISVLTNGGLSAWALDQSNIYYYTDPVMVAPYQELSGSVLRMSGIAWP